ncbi:MAG: hypothetical protein Q8Q42_02625 [Nanoarchaeota archaeon]|nr:hypothetical protein [Nanoarchaeota archaeon]
MKKRVVYLFILLLLISFVFAHEDEEGLEDFKDDTIEPNEGIFRDFLPASFIITIFIFSLIPILYLIFYKRSFSKKHILFWIIVYIVGSVTLVVVADTINLTLNSETKGPVHWHADFQIWNCGEELDLVEPEGMLNRIGTELFHEHNDGRMHAEGIINDVGSVDLHNFFNFIGGNLIGTSFNVPTDNGVVEAENGDLCNGESGEVQIFLYKVVNSFAKQKSGFLVEQSKVDENYVLSGYQDVPPGDCIIVEFDKKKDKTDKICETYKIAIEKGDMIYGN